MSSIRALAGRLPEVVGWVALTGVVLGVVLFLGFMVASDGVDHMLHAYPDSKSLGGASGMRHARLIGIELVAVPLIALAAAWRSLGAERISALRGTRVGPYLPLLMAVALGGLFSYLLWIWGSPRSSFGPDEFDVTRWLGTVLLAVFTIVWLPLFPRVTALLAGMIAGPAVFAGLGYLFFESFLTMPPPTEVSVTQCFGLVVSGGAVLVVVGIGFVLLSGLKWWALVAIAAMVGLGILSVQYEFAGLASFLLIPVVLVAVSVWALRNNTLFQARPLTCAGVAAALMIGLAVMGTRAAADGCHNW